MQLTSQSDLVNPVIITHGVEWVKIFLLKNLPPAEGLPEVVGIELQSAHIRRRNQVLRLAVWSVVI